MLKWTEKQNRVNGKPVPAYTAELPSPYNEAAIYQYEHDGSLFLTCKTLGLERIPLNSNVPELAYRNAEEIMLLAFLTYESGARSALALL